MKKILYITIFFSFSIYINAFSQTKYEKEYGIKSTEVPEIALRFIDSLGFNSKVKWYREEGLTVTTIEAKTTYKRQKYSIEFALDGVLEDVEIEVNWREISSETEKKISEYLKSRYQKYKVEKIQIQYSGSQKAVKAKVMKEPFHEVLTVKYEIIIVARVDKTFRKFEYQFSGIGEFLQMSEIVLKNSDNLVY